MCVVRRGPSLGRQVGGWWIVNGGAGQCHTRVRYVRLRATIIRSFYNRSQVVPKSETPISVDRPIEWYVSSRFDILLICVIPLVVDEAASILVILGGWGSRTWYDWITAICFTFEAMVLSWLLPNVLLTQSECIFNVDCFVCASVSRPC